MRFQLVPAAYVVFRREREGRPQILLQQRQNTGYYDGYWATATAGHVEAGESVLQAAVREVSEELGVTISASELEPLTVMHRTQGTAPIDQRVDFFFTCRHWDGTPRILEPEKCSGLQWYDLDALPVPVVPHELVVIGALARGESLPMVLPYGFDA